MSATRANLFNRLLLSVLLMFLFAGAKAQLCTGSLGDPVVNTTFDAGDNPGPALPTTNYKYISGDCPYDGEYAIRNNTSGCYFQTWHALPADHTGNPNGYFMLVNASFQPGDFYVETVRGLCGNTNYEFAAWVINVLKPESCNNAGIRPNLTFSIETTSGTKLSTFNSGDIAATSTPQWKQYGLFFTTPANVSDVVVRITNNAPGGCGNDLALDDITFRPCGARIKTAIEGLSGNKVEYCEGTNASYRFTAAVTVGFSNPDMQWQESKDGGVNWSDIAGAKSALFQWKSGAGGDLQYRIVVAEKGNINSASCRIASAPIEVQMKSLPQIAADALNNVCEGSALQMKASAKFANNDNGTIKWQVPTGSGFINTEQQQGNDRISSLVKMRTELTDAGMYIVQAISSFGCLAQDSIRLEVYNKPKADFIILGAACAGSPVQLRSSASVANSTVADQFWSWGNNESSNSVDIAPVFAIAGNHAVQLRVRSSNGCTSDTLTRQVQIKANPVASFILPEVCLADPYAEFINTSTVEGGGAMSYRWTFGDGTNPGFFSNDKLPRYRYTAVGNYQVKLQVTSSGGCKADTMQSFTVNGSVPKAFFSLDARSVNCSAEPVVIRNGSTVDFGSITKVEIYWKNDTDVNARTVDESPVADKQYQFDYHSYLNGAATKFTIRFVAFSGSSCVSETTQEITVHRSPEVVFDTLQGVCQEASAFQITQVREVTGISGTGIYAGAGIDASGLFVPGAAGAGNHTIQYRFTSQAGCSDTVSQLQRVWVQPKVDAGPDRTVVAGGTIAINASAQGEALQFQWAPATGLNNATILKPVSGPVNDITYNLTATSLEGCSATDAVQVRVIPELYIPNVFTPNGDGVNETWQVPFLESFPGAEVRVFSRYGQEIFYTMGNARKWDGRLGGKHLPSGAYAYLVDLKNGSILRGTVMLLR